MRIVLFSDIHGNLEALESFLYHIQKKENIDQLICLGDIVGYGANPNECVEEIRQLNCPTVIGNHDYVAVGKGDISYFNHFAREAILWTREQLNKENIKYLKNLPFTYREDSYLTVHSSPQYPEKWKYIMTIDAAFSNMKYFNEQFCFIGHSHIPCFFVMDKDGNCELSPHSKINYKPEHRYLINVGSIGQPRDFNPKSSFILLDTDSHTIELKRTSYDIGKAQSKINKAGLPILLAQRLQDGY